MPPELHKHAAPRIDCLAWSDTLPKGSPTHSLYRYVRWCVNCISHWTFRPIPIPDEPKYTSQDVTVVIPTISLGGIKFEDTLRSCLRADPLEVIVVATDANFRQIDAIASALSKRIRVLSVSKANKRLQMCRAIPEVSTAITVFADDDVIWPPKVLAWILAPFEDQRMGGVGTSQRLQRPEKPNFWDFLGASYLERRNFDISACTHMDGGLPCLSGRTVAYRTMTLNEPEFTYAFNHEKWRGHLFSADDDNFLTRWMLSHGWKTHVQYHKECEVQTTLESNSKYLAQCLRWSRSNWRSNLTSMFVERHTWSKQPWSTYAVQQTTVTAWSLPVDLLLLWLCFESTASWAARERYLALGWLLLWKAFTVFWKHLGHFIRYPVDVVYLLPLIGFGWLHSIYIKPYALMSLNATTWGSRSPDADRDDAIRIQRIPPMHATKPLVAGEK